MSASRHARAQYHAARRALAVASTLDDARAVRDQAAAVRNYARRAKNRDLELDAAELYVRAERRLGELLRELPGTVRKPSKGVWHRPRDRA